MSRKVLSYVFNRATVAPGEVFEVGVPSMAGYGYEWELEKFPMNGLSKIGTQDIPEYGESRAKRFRIRADAKGVYEFNVRLHNPQATKKPVKISYPFKITVK